MPADASRPDVFFERAPRPELRPFVRRFLAMEFPAAHRDLHLPLLGSVAAFTFQGRCRLNGGGWVPPAAFTGIWGRLRSHEHSDGHGVLLALFTPVGAAAWVRPPLSEFRDVTTELADAFGERGEVERVHDGIRRAPSSAERVDCLEDFLIASLRASVPDPLVAAAVRWLERSGSPGRIDALTKHIGLSQSALERRFRRVVGLPPKGYASLVRLDRAVRLRAAGCGFAEAACEAGYFDQSHFIHEFRRTTGAPPDAFFRASA